MSVMSIEEEIKNLRYQAQNDIRTGYPELAAWRNQIADWLTELMKLKDFLGEDDG